MRSRRGRRRRSSLRRGTRIFVLVIDVPISFTQFGGKEAYHLFHYRLDLAGFVSNLLFYLMDLDEL